jgi:hypothetical protein
MRLRGRLPPKVRKWMGLACALSFWGLELWICHARDIGMISIPQSANKAIGSVLAAAFQLPLAGTSHVCTCQVKDPQASLCRNLSGLMATEPCISAHD